MAARTASLLLDACGTAGPSIDSGGLISKESPAFWPGSVVHHRCVRQSPGLSDSFGMYGRTFNRWKVCVPCRNFPENPSGGAVHVSCTLAATNRRVAIPGLLSQDLEYDPYSSYQPVYVRSIHIGRIGSLEHDPPPAGFHVSEAPAIKGNRYSTCCIPIVTDISFRELK